MPRCASTHLNRTAIGARAPPGQNSAGQLQNLVGPPQFRHLAFQLLDPVRLNSANAGAGTASNLVTLDPRQPRRRNTANLRRNRIHCRPQ